MSGCLVGDPFFIDNNAGGAGTTSGGVESRGGTAGTSAGNGSAGNGSAGNGGSGNSSGSKPSSGGRSSGGASTADAARGGAGQGGNTSNPQGGTLQGSTTQAGSTTGGSAQGGAGSGPSQAGAAPGGSAGNWTLAGFESDTEGFGPSPGMENNNSVATSALFKTEGKQGLQVTVRNAAWVGTRFDNMLNLSGAQRIKFDVRTTQSSLRCNVAIATGESGWCEADLQRTISASTTTTVEVSLRDRNCANFDSTRVRGVYLWFDVGTFYIDYLRTE